ncbi:MAG: hypothetical protein JNL56_14005 [Alphaproteobacteria bacterium]|nr:hypothetical protein [Alphaproteobacteria bacterium]
METGSTSPPLLFERPDRLREPLYVVTVVFNPVRFRSRWRLYQEFARRIERSGAILQTVEVAFGERPFVMTEAGNPRHVQLRTSDELWIKENALNLGIARLPWNWKYVAWIDADVAFSRDDWVDETLQQLQHYDVVQLFSDAIDLSKTYEFMTLYKSFAFTYLNTARERALIQDPNGGGNGKPAGPYAYLHHPGFAWAATRRAVDGLGGLYDQAIIGEGDYIMAKCLVGEGEATLRPECSAGFRESVAVWERRAQTAVQRRIGYVSGTLLHYWHGPKSKRQYYHRTKLIADTGYDPARDIQRDWQGLYHLSSGNWTLRDGLKAYFRQRDEDE